MKYHLISFLNTGIFHVKSFYEAQCVAEAIASLCENPMLAQMGLFELFSNGIEHGNLGITPNEKEKLQQEGIWLAEIERRLLLPENQKKFLEIEFIRNPEEFEIVVRDQGPGFNWREYQQNHRCEKETHGRGILIAKEAAFKKLIYQDPGNIVHAFIK